MTYIRDGHMFVAALLFGVSAEMEWYILVILVCQRRWNHTLK